jgi:hypothetical protein
MIMLITQPVFSNVRASKIAFDAVSVWPHAAGGHADVAVCAFVRVVATLDNEFSHACSFSKLPLLSFKSTPRSSTKILPQSRDRHILISGVKNV